MTYFGKQNNPERYSTRKLTLFFSTNKWHKESAWEKGKCLKLQKTCYILHAVLLQSYLTLCNLWTVAHQAPLSMGFSRQEYWSGLPCPPPGDLPNPEIESVSLRSPALADRFLTTSTTWEALLSTYKLNSKYRP